MIKKTVSDYINNIIKLVRSDNTVLLADIDLPSDYIENILDILDEKGVSIVDNHGKRLNESLLDRAFLNFYDESLPQLSVLSVEQEIELFEKVSKGDNNARDSLILHNLRYVAFVAKKYYSSVLTPADLIQEGTLGLIEAISRFDHSRGFRFITYARFWIEKSITEAIQEYGKDIKVPVSVINGLRSVYRASNVLLQRLGRNPSSAEIVEELDHSLTIDAVESLLSNSSQPISLDIEVEGTDLHELVPDTGNLTPSESAEFFGDLECVESAINKLSPREKKVVIERFGLNERQPKTLEEIGMELNLTREAIRYIEKKAINKIQKELSL